MATNIKTEFSKYLYSRLPRVYRVEDKELVLKRFLELFAEGGYQPLVEETMGIMDLIDVDKCPKKFLPLLARSLGYFYSEDIPELFQRRILKYIVEFYKRKGTKSVITFMARELSGFEIEIIENKDFTESDIQVTGWNKEFKNYRNFILKLKAPEETSQLQNKEDVIRKTINNFLPTNSNVLIVTAYWIEENRDIIKEFFESDFKNFVKDLNEELMGYNDFQVIDENKVTKSVVRKDGEEIQSKYTTEEEINSGLKYSLEAYEVPLNTNYVILKDLITKLIEDEEISLVNNTIYSEYGIIKLGLEEDLKYNLEGMEYQGENSALNKTLNVLNSFFITNGVYCYDVIKEAGKEDVIKFL